MRERLVGRLEGAGCHAVPLLSGVLDVANKVQSGGAGLVSLSMYSVKTASGWATECGGKALGKIAKKSCKLVKTYEMVSEKTGQIAANLHMMKSFTEGTLVLTRNGYVAIDEVRVGDEVAAIDEKTGQQVWRRVVEYYSRQAPSTLTITLEAADGGRETITATPEHPFHVEGWSTSTGDLLAALDGTGGSGSDVTDNGLAGSRLVPSPGKTQFGDWVKAGALRPGDHVSTANSIAAHPKTLKPANDNADKTGGKEAAGADQAEADANVADVDAQPAGPMVPLAANDNRPLTVAEILFNDNPARVYNFEVESRPGEITHNYLIGDHQAWVHNGRYISVYVRRNVDKIATGPDGILRCEYCGTPVKKGKGYSCSQEYDHADSYSGGGGNDLENIISSCRDCNREKSNAPLGRWLRKIWK